MAESVSDAILLERFVTDREEAAFAALVRRHGPRVERICRRILADPNDVEDVFQATFLVLARKAAAIPWRDSINPWIDSVARRLALHSRSGVARLRAREVGLTTLAAGQACPDGRLPDRFHPAAEPSAEIERRELHRVLHDELLRLPEKYRAPVVLCDLEGHTREEAARRLGWPTGSMSRRLDRGRSLLRHRLTGRGLALGVIGLASLAVAIGLRFSPPGQGPAVRQAMTVFRPEREGGHGYASVLASASRTGGSEVDFSRILPAARAAASAARRLERLEPTRSADLWGRLAIEMRDSAVDLERACEASDPEAVVAAARRLDASCVRCHAAFRLTPDPGTARLPALPRLSDPPGPASGRRPDAVVVTNEDADRSTVSRPGPTHPSPGLAATAGSLLLASNEGKVVGVRTGGNASRTFGARSLPVSRGPYPPDPNPSRPDLRDERCRSDESIA